MESISELDEYSLGESSDESYCDSEEERRYLKTHGGKKKKKNRRKRIEDDSEYFPSEEEEEEEDDDDDKKERTPAEKAIAKFFATKKITGEEDVDTLIKDLTKAREPAKTGLIDVEKERSLFWKRVEKIKDPKRRKRLTRRFGSVLRVFTDNDIPYDYAMTKRGVCRFLGLLKRSDVSPHISRLFTNVPDDLCKSVPGLKAWCISQNLMTNNREQGCFAVQTLVRHFLPQLCESRIRAGALKTSKGFTRKEIYFKKYEDVTVLEL